MYTVRPEHYDPVRTICDTWARQANRLSVATNQKAIARDEGIKMGTSKGMAEAMAWFLTVRRCERYSKWDYVASVEVHACEKFMHDFIIASDETFGKLPNNVNTEGYDDLKAEAELKFMDWYEPALHQLVFPHDMEANELERHKAAVGAGKEPATPEDAAWIEEDLKHATELLESMKAVRDSISNSTS